MNKKKIMDLITKKEGRKKGLNTQADEIISKENPTAEEVRSLANINKETKELEDEIKELRSLADLIPDEVEPINPDNQEMRSNDPNASTKIQEPDTTKRAMPQGQLNVLGTYGLTSSARTGQQQEYEALKTKYEQRGQDLKDKKRVTFDVRKELPISRSITVASSNLVVPDQYSNTLNETYNQVSSIVDLVHAVPMMGGETYTKGFKKPTTDSADYTDEESSYKKTDLVWDKVTIPKSYITDYTEISKQAIKLPNIDYQSQIGGGLRDILRRKVSREILIGDGSAGHLVGIFNAPENVIPKDSDLEITEIDADTLDKIVFGYGGDEDVEGAAYLVLSKKDLAAFAAIRTADGKKLYNIKVNGNTGTISSDNSFSVNYVLNSVCPSLSLEDTAAGSYCMAYGILKNYELAVFSDIGVEMSTDYKFGEGMVAYAGDIYTGGNVAAWKGFLRIKKSEK